MLHHWTIPMRSFNFKICLRFVMPVLFDDCAPVKQRNNIHFFKSSRLRKNMGTRWLFSRFTRNRVRDWDFDFKKIRYQTSYTRIKNSERNGSQKHLKLLFWVCFYRCTIWNHLEWKCLWKMDFDWQIFLHIPHFNFFRSGFLQLNFTKNYWSRLYLDKGVPTSNFKRTVYFLFTKLGN